MPDNALLWVGSVVLLLGGLIFVHELGHFLTAKLLGVKVLKFSIGFGPKVVGVRRGETEYLLSLLPLGGYVKMAGDDPSQPPDPADRGRGFLEQTPSRRFAIAAAGPAANLLFPVLIYLALGLAQNGSPTAGPTVGTVFPGSPAEGAGLRPGDRIASVRTPDGRERRVRWFADLRRAVSPHPGEPLAFTVERGGERLELSVVPGAERESNPIETTVRGVIGITADYTPAVVAPVRRGAAGPVEPFDLVVRVGETRVLHSGDLGRALEAARCAPVALEVIRERPVDLPGAPLSTHAPITLPSVPTCRDGKPTLAVADPLVSTFVGAVVPGGPAQKAGLARGDAIAAANGKPVRSFREVNAVLGASVKVGEPVSLSLADGRTLSLVPEAQTQLDEMTGEKKSRPFLGFEPDQRGVVLQSSLLAEQVTVRMGFLEVAGNAVGNLGDVIRLTALGIARIADGTISFKTVGGPIMLFRIAAQAAEEGLQSFLFKMALISVNLGIMNLLPIPVLDGGHLAACLVEGVTRRPLSLRTREIANLVGILLLVLLMIAVFKNDIVRLMG
ncbi:MAG TPA: site-2 protease family protein [Anaeromyxobacteraceae bacterium]|nr:site-2 protease family protein [Anaeromyxobacteraceae bacterium]